MDLSRRLLIQSIAAGGGAVANVPISALRVPDDEAIALARDRLAKHLGVHEDTARAALSRIQRRLGPSADILLGRRGAISAEAEAASGRVFAWWLAGGDLQPGFNSLVRGAAVLCENAYVATTAGAINFRLVSLCVFGPLTILLFRRRHMGIGLILARPVIGVPPAQLYLKSIKGASRDA